MAQFLGRFVLLFAVTMAILTALWPFLVPGYAEGIAMLSRPLFRLVERPNVTVLDVQGAEVWVYRVVGEGRVTPVVWFDRFTFFALIPLFCLFVATPGLGVWRRAARTALGLGVLGVIHAFYLVASVELLYGAAAHALEAWQVVVRIVWEAAPVGIWVALTFGVWRRHFSAYRLVFKKREDPQRVRGTVWNGLRWKEKEGTS